MDGARDPHGRSTEKVDSASASIRLRTQNKIKRQTRITSSTCCDGRPQNGKKKIGLGVARQREDTSA